MRARLITACLVLCACLMLAGCGTLVAAPGTPSPTAPGGSALNGCLIQQAPTGLAPADVIVKAKTVNSTPTENTPVALRHG